MSSPTDRAFTELLKRDKRFKVEAYVFVYETLDFAQNVLHLGQREINEPLPFPLDEEEEVESSAVKKAESEPQNHVTGQDLCVAAREYAWKMYGFLAPMVLASMGIRKTGDIGDIVFNLIGTGQMRKTAHDRREDFDDVFDFDTAFSQNYKIANDP